MTHSNIHVVTNKGEEFLIPISDLNESVGIYPKVWRSSPSPHNYPQKSSNHTPAGSIVSYPYEEVSLNDPSVEKITQKIGITPNYYLKERKGVSYSCVVVCDFDSNCHVGKYFNDKPHPHWNFKIKRIVNYNSREKNDYYEVRHKKDTNVPKCNWIEVQLEINGMKLTKKRFYWSKESQRKNSMI